MQEHVQVDSSKCKACRRCEFACIASHHGLDIKTAMKMKGTYAPRCWAVKGDDYKTSVRCHGCNPAPCCAICPTGALEQHKDGSFSIHLELCAGCMMCQNVCPYGVITPEMIPQANVPDSQSAPDKVAIAVRCDLCADWRAEKGVEYTACMEACTTRALILVKADGTIVEAPVVEKKPAAKAAVAQAPAKDVKPAEAPVKEAKPAEAPAKDAKPAEAPVKEAKPAEAPVKEAKPAEAPAKDAKPAEAPVKEAKPAEAPVKDAKPAQAPAKDVKPAEAPVKDVKPAKAAPKEAPKEKASAPKEAEPAKKGKKKK